MLSVTTARAYRKLCNNTLTKKPAALEPVKIKNLLSFPSIFFLIVVIVSATPSMKKAIAAAITVGNPAILLSDGTSIVATIRTKDVINVQKIVTIINF